MATFRLQPTQVKDLKLIAQLGPYRLIQVAAHLESAVSAPLSVNELRNRIQESIGQEPVAPEVDGKAAEESHQYTDSIVRQCLQLHSLMRQLGLSDQEVLDGIRNALKNVLEVGEFQSWLDVENAFCTLLIVPSVRVAAVALDVSYDYQSLLQRARILTDIRPVFDEDASEISAAVVSFTLRLKYDSAGSEHTISIALDASDVSSIQDQCTRALRKAELAKSLFKEKTGLPTMIVGDKSND